MKHLILLVILAAATPTPAPKAADRSIVQNPTPTTEAITVDSKGGL